MLLDRLNYTIKEGAYIINELDRINKDIPEEELRYNKELIEIVERLKEIYEISNELYEFVAKKYAERTKEV